MASVAGGTRRDQARERGQLASRPRSTAATSVWADGIVVLHSLHARWWRIPFPVAASPCPAVIRETSGSSRAPSVGHVAFEL